MLLHPLTMPNLKRGSVHDVLSGFMSFNILMILNLTILVSLEQVEDSWMQIKQGHLHVAQGVFSVVMRLPYTLQHDS